MTMLEANYEARIQKLDDEYRRYSTLVEEVTQRYAQLQASLEHAYQKRLAEMYELDDTIQQKTNAAAQTMLAYLTAQQLLAEIQRRLEQ